MKTNPLLNVSDKELWNEWQRAEAAWRDASDAGKVREAKAFSKRVTELEAEWFRRYPVVERAEVYSGVSSRWNAGRNVTSETARIAVDNSWCVGLK
jgi:hypothetical protein